MVNRIIVPLDGSSISHAALPPALGLAELTGASLTLLGAISPPNDMLLVPQDASRSRMTPRDIERLSGENERQEGYLHQIAATLLKGTSVTTAVRLGNPAEEILEIAEESTDPLIVMASHGRSGLGRVLLGSVAPASSRERNVRSSWSGRRTIRGRSTERARLIT
jgi:nucleotide-binding universal stress UspA family protein